LCRAALCDLLSAARRGVWLLQRLRGPTAAGAAGAHAGAEIACIAVPDRYIADEWLALEPTNLRSAPVAGAEVIETVKRGATFRAYAEEHKWLCVETADGATGFVWSDRAKKIHTGPMTPEMKALHRCAGAKDEAAW
jgi:Bacterial SH3 domain